MGKTTLGQIREMPDRIATDEWTLRTTNKVQGYPHQQINPEINCPPMLAVP